MWCNAVNHYQNSSYSEGLPEDKAGLTGPSPALHYNTSIVFDIGFFFSTLYSIG